MKMNNIVFFLVLCTLSGCATAESLTLSLKRGHGITSSNLAHYAYNDLDYAVADSVHYAIGVGFVHGFVTNDDESIIYSLSGGPVLHAGSMETRAHLGSWPLTRWEGELTPEINAIYEIPGKGGTLRNPELLGEQYSYVFHPGGFERSLGCYMETPLRYGEVLSLPEKEIVVFLGRPMHRDAMGMRILDMVVLSPSAGGIAFAMRAARENQGPSPGDDDYYPMPLPSRPQFITSVYYDSAAPGTRSYAKMYTSDFNEDEKEDVIVWRKRYVSNNIENSVIGFHLDKDIVNHYTLVEGQYVLQETPEATVRSWLTTNNLTWQSGFPSRSECAGQEDQLIPEMHDPLLNDPDVLQ